MRVAHKTHAGYGLWDTFECHEYHMPVSRNCIVDYELLGKVATLAAQMREDHMGLFGYERSDIVGFHAFHMRAAHTSDFGCERLGKADSYILPMPNVGNQRPALAGPLD